MIPLTLKLRSRSPQRGVTLIELMVAMVLGLVVSGGIITVFSSTSSSNRAQTQLARLQEEGRFAISRLGSDLRLANGLYCNNSGGTAAPSASGTFLDNLRSPRVYANGFIAGVGGVSGALGDVTTTWGSGGYPSKPTDVYSMPSFLFMRGYDCTLTTCTPVDPTIAGLPAMGTTEGKRVKGADVITVRYVDSDRGWSIGEAGGSTLAGGGGGGGAAILASVNLIPLAGEPPVSDFDSGDLAMLADCSGAQIFDLGNVTAGLLTVAGGDNVTSSAPVVPAPQSAPKLFNVNRDFRTVTYYLRVVSVNNDGNAPFTGALMRRVNGGLANSAHGGSEDELVRGVERLDFRYGVEDTDGNTTFLSAAEVDAATNCPPQELAALTTVGCVWRGIKSIEASILMNGQVPLYTLSGNDLLYAYSADANTGLLAPSAHATKPGDQGFPDPLLRREFTALVAVRNFNP